MTHHSFYLKLKIGLIHQKYLNPDLSKQLHEAIFSKMCTNEDHPPIYFNNIPVTHTAWKMSIFGVFVVRIFQNSGWIRRDTEYLSVFSPNTGKYKSVKTLYLDTLHAVLRKNNQSFAFSLPLPCTFSMNLACFLFL